MKIQNSLRMKILYRRLNHINNQNGMLQMRQKRRIYFFYFVVNSISSRYIDNIMELNGVINLTGTLAAYKLRFAPDDGSVFIV